MTTFDSALLRRVAASIRDTNYGRELKSLAEAEADRIDAKADELEASERLAIGVGRVAIEASEGVAYGSKPDDFFHAAGEAVLGWLPLNGWKLHAASWGYGGGAAVHAPEVRGKTREELLSEKVEKLQTQVKRLSRVAVNAADHSIPTLAEPAEGDVEADAPPKPSKCLELSPVGSKCNLADGHDGYHKHHHPHGGIQTVLWPPKAGPWERIQDIPNGILQVSDGQGRTWLKVGGTWRFEWVDKVWHEPFENANKHAPFTAVGGAS